MEKARNFQKNIYFNGNPLQYSCLENPMDRRAWKAAVRGVAEGQTRLSDFTFTFPFHTLEKEMATHSSFLAWRIPGTGEPGGLPSMGSHRVRHDWSDLAAAAGPLGKWDGEYCFPWVILLLLYPTPHYLMYMDLISVMTYDLRGSWDGFTGEDSPLFSGPNDKGDNKYFSMVSKDLG